MALAAEVKDVAPDPRWIARCARRLRQRWPNADQAGLDEAAAELWRDVELQRLDPVEAADRWLEPVTAPAELHLGVRPAVGTELSRPGGIVLAHGRSRG